MYELGLILAGMLLGALLIFGLVIYYVGKVSKNSPFGG
jgi:hypothetical protein